jgi:exodeoxyribonuclease-5
VAQALGQVPKVDDTGREVFEGGDGKKSSAKLTIVDEASMVNAKSYEELKTLSPRILWVGDKYQLPPVEEKDSKAFSSLSVSVKSELKEVVRYSGAIADFCEFLRQGGRELPDPDNKTIFVLDRKEWIEQALISAKEGLSLSDSNYSKVLSYRNVIADAHNAKIKAHLFPDQKEPFFEGLRLVCSSPIQRLESKSFGRVSKTVWSVKATNSEELLITSTPEKRNLTVDDFDEEPASFYSLVSGLTIWEFRVETEAGLSLLLRVLTPDSDEKRKEMIAHLQGEIDSLKKAGKKATSEQFDALTCLRRFPDNIADTFALTTHKSQGSGYKNVFVDWPDLIKSKDDVKQQLIYTACTRATGRLFITRN